MFHWGNSVRKIVGNAIAMLCALAAASGTAYANVITVGDGSVKITCEKKCEAFTYGGAPEAPVRAGDLSETAADLYRLSSGGLDTEAAALSILLGDPDAYSSASARRVTVGQASSSSFSTLSRFIVLRISDEAVFLSSPTRNRITIEFPEGGSKGEIAHYTEFGNLVPMPSFVWLLMLAAVGFFFAGRVRAQTA